MDESFDKFIQHKGLSINKEAMAPNSLESILLNYKGRIECDTFLLRDGNIAIINEKEFGKSRAEIENLNLNELEKLRINTLCTETDQMVPLLDEFIGLAADTDTSVALEIRSSTIEKSKELTLKIIEQLTNMQKTGGFKSNPEFIISKLSLQSFSVQVLKTINEIGQLQKQKFNTTLFWPSDEVWAEKVEVFDWKVVNELNNRDLTWQEKGIEVAVKNQVTEIEFQPFVITKELIEKAHSYGLKVGVAVTKNEDLAKKLIEDGVDYIKTEK